MRAAILTGVLALAVAAASASASVIVTVTDLGSATSDPYGDTATGFEAFLLSASASSGSLIGGVDAGGGTSPFTGITVTAGSAMLQQWDIGRTGESATPNEPLYGGNATFINGSNDPYGLDSHFVFPTDPSTGNPLYVSATTLSETFNSTNLPGSPADVPGSGGADWGSGTSLTGNASIDAGYNVADQPIAYILLPTGDSANYDIGVQEISAATGDNIGGVQVFTGTIGAAAVPEPASLGLLGVGSLLMLRRRRKK